MEAIGNKNDEKCVTIFYCNLCDHKFVRKYDYDRHLMSLKHLGNTKKNSFCCDKCTRKYISEKDYTIHLLTCISNRGNKILRKNAQDDNQIYKCKKCCVIYKSRAGLWKHEQKCSGFELKTKEPNLELNEVKEIFSMMMKTNDDFQKLMLESNRAMIESQQKFMEHATNTIVNNNTTYNTNTNTNTINNKFNLNFFLNETCKDAMNIMDFVEMVKSQLKLKDFGAYENGYSNTVSGLFLRGLEGLEVNQRPIHCSDLKREIIYVKDNDVWHLDSRQEIVTKAVKYISHYNFKQMPVWQKAHPECEDTGSKVHDHYMKLLRNCMSGGTDAEIDSNYKKIIRNVMKEVVIDKKKFTK